MARPLLATWSRHVLASCSKHVLATCSKHVLATCSRTLVSRDIAIRTASQRTIHGLSSVFRIEARTLNGARTRGLLRPRVDHVFVTCSRRGFATPPGGKKESLMLPPLQVPGRRPVRKRRDRDQPQDQESFPVCAYSTCEEVDLHSLRHTVRDRGLYEVCSLPKDLPDAMFLRATYGLDEEPREIIVFREGCVTFWNMPQTERAEFLRLMWRHQKDSFSPELVHAELEEMIYTFQEGATRLEENSIILDKTLPAEDVVLHKYTFSNALALSVKLNIWEASLEGYIDSIESITEDLRRGVVNGISRSAALKKTGELFTLRHLINLSSDLLDTPDFYWDRTELERLYTKMSADLSITKRTKVMNEKINCCVELMSLLRNDLNDQHHTRLEWMIIILILVEVIFEVVHYIERDPVILDIVRSGDDR